MLLALVLIPVVFYTYNGVIAPFSDWINVIIFFIPTAIAYVYEKLKFDRNRNTC